MFGRSCVNCHSNIHGSNHPSGPVLHAVTRRHEHATPRRSFRWSFSRRCRRAATGAGAGAERRRRRQRRRHAGSRRRRHAGRDRRAVAQPVRADRPGALHRRPLDQHRRRPGALPALPGHPRRAALLRLPLRVRAARRRLARFSARAEQRRLARPGVLRRLQPRRQAVDHRELAADPAVLQRRHDDALHGQRRHAAARRCGAARRSRTAQATSAPTSRIAPQFELRERRDIGRVDVVATPTPKLDVTASFTTQKHGGELPWGASFGFSNDVEVPLPYDSRTNDFTIGTEWTNTKQHAARRLQRLVVRQPRRPRSSGTARCASTTRRARRDAAACRCGRRTRRRRSASAATPSWRTRRRSPASSPTACGATTSRCSRSRSIRRCRRLRCRAPTPRPKRTSSRPT